MRFLINILLFFSLATQANAQFYYMDILSTKQTNQQYMLLRNFQIKKISATSFDGNEASKDFVLEQIIDKDGKQITTRTASINNEESYFISSFSANRVYHTVDSSKNAISTVDYTYDKAGKILSITSDSKDFDGTFTNTETHIWSYDEKGHPEKMLKVKNSADSTWVTFSFDEDDNLSEEKWQKKNRVIENYYYYYNPKKQLTDIVRYSNKANKLIPDYMFEYDNTGHHTQLTQTQGGLANYIVWKYFYNENGLKDKEMVYDKKQQLMGRIEYRYW